VPVSSSYALAGGTRYGFTVGSYDKRYPLVVDPGIRYSTFLGGSLNDEAFGIEVGGRDVYVTGSTQSLDFPTTLGALDSTENGSDDVFVTKFDNEGEELIYSTYLGGTLSDVGESVAVDGSGHAYITGETESANFPTTLGVVQPTLRGTEDAFVAKLDANGTRLVYSTYLGGTLPDQGRGIEVQAGHAYVAGVTFSSDYPVTPDSFDASFNGVTEAFVTKLDSGGDSIAYSTFLGGALDDVGRGITLRGGFAYVTGYTGSVDFPTKAAVQPTNRGARDAFVTKFDTDGMATIFSTYLGGTSFDEGYGVEADGQGNAYVTGDTFSADFPVTLGAWDETYNLNGDAFVTKLDESGAMLIYSTYLGGIGSDGARSVSIDGSGNATAGNAYVAGSTNSLDFDVTPGAFQPVYGGGTSDAFLTEFTVDGAALLYSTYLGGQNRDTARSVSVRDGDPYMTGFTTSATFPTTPGAWDEEWNGNRDAFVTAFDLRSG
jgi:hypothetical protein